MGTYHQSIIESHDALLPMLLPSLYRSIMLSSEKDSSNWVTALPLTEHGFCLHKGTFHDSLCLQYNWQPHCCLPIVCVCGKQFSVEHAPCCPHGGLPTIHNNGFWDITAGLLTL